MSEKRMCALYGFEIGQKLDELRKNLEMGRDPTGMIDDTYNNIINLENFCDVNLENSKNAMLKVKDYISNDLYLHAVNMVNKMISDDSDESIPKQLRK